MAASVVSYETAKRLQDMGLWLGLVTSETITGITVTDMRNALEGMESRRDEHGRTHHLNAWYEFIYAYLPLFGHSKKTAIDMATDAELMAAAVIEYLEWRAKG